MDERSLLNEIIEFDTLENTEIDASFLDQQSRKTTKLVNNSSEVNFQKGKSRDFNFNFKEPVFVSEIRIYSSGYTNGHSIEIESKNIFGKSASSVSSVQNGETVFLIGKFIKSFYFKPSRSINTGKKIERVVIEGLIEDDFAHASLDFSKLHKLKEKIISKCQLKISEVERKQELLDSIKSEIDELNQEKSQTTDELTNLADTLSETHDELDETKKSIAAQKSEISELNNRIDNAADTLNITTNQKNQLNKEISEKQNQLKLLVDDINLFPTEIKAFVSQGAKNISRYTILALIPILAIGAITLALFCKAADLTSVISDNPEINIWGIFLTRLPYVAICASILAASYKLAKIFIAEIIKINDQRLNLSKISIIAKDVQHAATEGLDLTDEQKANLNTQLKMKMLQDHLKSYLTEDFNFSNENRGKKNKDREIKTIPKNESLDQEEDIRTDHEE